MSPCTNAHLRYQGLGSRNVNVRVEEETTHDSETDHGVEAVSYLERVSKIIYVLLTLFHFESKQTTPNRPHL